MLQINKPKLPPPRLPNNEAVFKRPTPMKVTVKFGTTSVVVPVTDGMLVSDLTEAAVHRYKKISNKSVNSLVEVKHLQSSTGGILYADDPLVHVIDDKEQIVAVFDEQDICSNYTNSPYSNVVSSRNVDGSSVGTTSNSPDFVRSSSTNSSAGSNGGGIGGNESVGYMRKPKTSTPNGPIAVARGYVNGNRQISYRNGGQEDVYVKNVNQQPYNGDNFERNKNINRPQDATNSVFVKHLDDIPASSSLLVVRRGSEPALNGQEAEEDNVEASAQQVVLANVNRGKNVKWPTHPDLAYEGRSSTDTEDDISKRFNTNGSSSTASMVKFVRNGARKSRVTEEMLEVAAQLAEDRRSAFEDHEDRETHFASNVGKSRRFEICNITITTYKDDRKGFGFQLTPEYGEIGQLSALIVKSIQPCLRCAESDSLKVDDRVVEINGRLVSEMTFISAQNMIQNEANNGSFTLKVMRRPNIQETIIDANMSISKKRDEATSNLSSTGPVGSTATLSNLQKANTRKIGRVMTIEIIKSSEGGLGFTLTSRDNAIVGDNITCVKNILPRGSAIKDGRLKEGDRFLEINGIDVTGYSKDKIVSMLRDVKEGHFVKLVVSRQENVAENASPVLPRHLPPDKANVDSLGSERYKQRLVFDIPLNNSGSAGLGVSVKGRTAGDFGGPRDCGIFVKAIMHGGAAHKDDRLNVNDQLIAVNEIDLTNLSNEDAINRLRKAMQELDPSASSIKLVVLRTIPSSGILEANATRILRPMSPPISSPGTPDGGSSLLLEAPGSYSPASIGSNRRSMHYIVPGYGDYAIVVKESLYHAPTLAQDSRVEEAIVIEDDDTTVTVKRPPLVLDSADTKSEMSAAEESDLYQTVNDPFVRDAPTRQSMSEKRKGAAKLDPSNTMTFKKIQHHRQTSAPSLQDPTVDGYSTTNGGDHAADMSTNVSKNLSNSGLMERRSLSLESLGPSTLVVVQQQQIDHKYRPTTSDDRPLIHEQIAANVLRHSHLHGPPSKVKSKSKLSSAQRARMTNESFRAAVDRSYDENGLEVGVDIGGDYDEGAYLDSPVDDQMGLATSESSRALVIAKDKSRRKSTGSGLSTLKNLFRFGSGGKSNKQLGLAYEERMAQQKQKAESQLQERARRQAEEEQRKIRIHYERLKQQRDQEMHQQLQQRQRVVSPNCQRAGGVMHPPLPGVNEQSQYFGSAPMKLPSHWRPPLPPNHLTYSPPLLHPSQHRSTGQLIFHQRYHSPSDPTAQANGFVRTNGVQQTYAGKNYDTDDGYGDFNSSNVETNRCYRSLERPSARSVIATTGAQRSKGAPFYEKPSTNSDIGTNIQQNGRQVSSTAVYHHRQPQHGQQSFVRAAVDDWQNFERQGANGLVEINSQRVNVNNNNYKSKRDHSSNFVSSDMPPIPPPDYDQYLRSTAKPKAPRKIRPTSDYVVSKDKNRHTTSLPRRAHDARMSEAVVVDRQQETVDLAYDSYGSLPRNGHYTYTMVRM